MKMLFPRKHIHIFRIEDLIENATLSMLPARIIWGLQIPDSVVPDYKSGTAGGTAGK